MQRGAADHQQVEDLVALMDAFSDRTLIDKRPTEILPAAPPGTPKTAELRLHFPDWTHRLDPAFPGKADAEK